METTEEKKERKEKEMKLILEFLEKYHQEMGYYPTVITRCNSIEARSEIGIMSLPRLEAYFSIFIPYQYRKKLTLDQKCRKRELVELRSIFFFLARCMGYTLEQIGTHFHNMHHSTVMHGIKLFKNLYETDDRYRDLYYKILNHIKKEISYGSSAMEHANKMESKS